MNESSRMEGTFFQTRTIIHVNSKALNADPLFNASFPLKFLSEVEAWCKVCSEGGLPSEMQELELAIHRHQSLYEQVTQAYTEVGQPRPSGGGTVVGGGSVGSLSRRLAVMSRARRSAPLSRPAVWECTHTPLAHVCCFISGLEC